MKGHVLVIMWMGDWLDFQLAFAMVFLIVRHHSNRFIFFNDLHRTLYDQILYQFVKARDNTYQKLQ